MIIDGKQNEKEFANYLNGKKVKELNMLFYLCFEEIFKKVKDEDQVMSWTNKKAQKTDLFIKINDEVKRVSLKCGIKNSVHVEPVTKFFHFLIENDVSNETAMEYLLFHYADGTTNNKGVNRLSTDEYKEKFQHKLDAINKEFNSERIIEKAVARFVVRGNNSYEDIDLIIHGTVDDFLWIKKEDIYKIILGSSKEYRTGIHFGSLLCQPLARNLNYNPKHEKCRYCVQIKWYSLFDDIVRILSNVC